jgi:hypothetical protein
MNAIADTVPAKRVATMHAGLLDLCWLALAVKRSSRPGITEEKLDTLCDALCAPRRQATALGPSTLIDSHRGRVRAGNERKGDAIFRLALPLTHRDVAAHASIVGRSDVSADGMANIG